MKNSKIYDSEDMRDSYNVGYKQASKEYKQVIGGLIIVFVIIVISIV